MVRVGAAAEMLGVCKETLRNWDKSGRLVPTRHPVTGYRYYQPKDLENFLANLLRQRESEQR
jgi:DNA (cytosine-5)-methyltransferase 1